MKRRYWVIGFGVVTTLVAGLLLYGIVTHTESGFASDNRWDHVPLSVACRDYAPSDDDVCETTVHVIDAINARLDFRMLVLVFGTADIEVVMRAPIEVGADEPGGFFELTGAKLIYSHCVVHTMNASGGAGDLEWLTVYHELGHCLGLAHDRSHSSIMRPLQYETPDQMIPPWISDFDRTLLRGVYAPQ